MTLTSDFILLDTLERKLFGSYSHEYIIDRFIEFNSQYINSETTFLHRQINGLIKEFTFISKPINYPGLTYIPIYTNKYDVRYARYITSLNYYNLYIENNVYTSLDQVNYSIDIDIIKNNTIEYNNYIIASNKTPYTRINSLINNFSDFSFWSNDLLRFLMYYEDRFIPNQPPDKQIYLIMMYLKYMYSNKQIVEEISPVDSIIFTVNGSELFAQRDSNYYNSVIPYEKYKNSLPSGYYTYSF